MKRKILHGIIYVLIGLSILWLILYQPDTNKGPSPYYEAEIVSLISETSEQLYDMALTTLTFEALITDNRLKNTSFILTDFFETGDPYHIYAEPGDKFLAYLEQDTSGNIETAHIVKFIRSDYVYLLVGIFIILILIVGGFKGLKALVALALTLLMVTKIILPQIMAGTDPVGISVLVTIIITVFSILIISGFNHKSYATMIGTILGVAIGGGIAIFISSQAKVMGLSFEESQFVKFAAGGLNLSFSGLLFASIILGALGAVMDVCMSVASTIEEIKQASPYIAQKDLFFSGMNVGRDVMGTMINTLILAYAGSSLIMMLMFFGYDIPFIEVINDDLMVTEIIRALAGTIGLISAIPITALVATHLNGKTQGF